jgi:prevent-host-death family protein
MSEATRVSIGQVKRDISELVNRVAYAGERIVLVSRGKPKAALVSVEDLAWLERAKATRGDAWQAWLAESDTLNGAIRTRQGGQDMDADAAWTAARADLETHTAPEEGDGEDDAAGG